MILLRAEASQNVSEGAEWAKHRKWHVDVDFSLAFMEYRERAREDGPR